MTNRTSAKEVDYICDVCEDVYSELFMSDEKIPDTIECSKCIGGTLEKFDFKSNGQRVYIND